VTSTAFQISLVVWPDFIRSNLQHRVWIAATLWMISGMLWAWWFFIRNKKIAKEEISASKSQTARDISGQMFQAEKIIYQEAIRHPPPIATPPPPLPILRLDFSGGTVEVHDAMVAFVDSRGQKCHSIRVHNMEAAAGEEAHRADAISTRLTYKTSGLSRTTSIDRACWIGNIENEIYLQPGDTKHVLIGISNNKNEWVNYHNPNQYPTEWPSSYNSLQEVKFPLFEGAKIIGEISVISHRNNKSITLVTRTFVITISDSKFLINIRWQDEA